jgi:hypothetical protein
MSFRVWRFAPSRQQELGPEYREPEDQEHQEDYGENVKQEAGDVGGGRRNVGEAENAGDDRYQKEDQRPFENCHCLLRNLSAAMPAATYQERRVAPPVPTRPDVKNGWPVTRFGLLNRVPDCKI